MSLRSSCLLSALCAVLVCASGCFSGNFNLISDGTEPLKEFTLSGSGSGRLALIPVNGVISLESEGNILRSRPGMVQETVSQLQMAEHDSRVKAVILLVNSPGGTVTASDLLYEEIRRFKARSGIKVAVCMLDVAASGGYYISLPADVIYAHPTTITGSVGVIFLRPQIDGLLKLIGVNVSAEKSGKYKDMGSPFRAASTEEQILFQNLINNMAAKFYQRLKLHRKISPEQFADISTARVFSADDALAAGLIDRIAYLEDAVSETKALAGLPPKARVIVYRRDHFNNDNPYIMDTRLSSGKPLVDTGMIGHAASASAGFYFLWPAVLP